MRPGQKHWVYIMTNKNRNVVYIGVTNNLKRRILEHETGLDKGFSKKYNCHFLIYFEEYKSINNAIKREKQIKGWRRSKKDALIKSINPQFHFLNETLKGL
jgi:putative endonuclease